jgi:hypothetical protein
VQLGVDVDCPQSTQIVGSPLLFFLPNGIILMRAKHNWGMLWMWFSIYGDWIFINRESIRENTIEGVDRDCPRSTCATNHGFS